MRQKKNIKMLKDLKEKIKEYWLWVAVIVIGVIATFGIFYFSNDCAKAGTIGDTLSGVFTSLAFICAIFTVALQRKELSLQRKELEQTRIELENQKKEFQIQNQTLKRQQFENTFFNMLSLHEDIIKSIEFLSYSGVSCTGRKSFKAKYTWVNSEYITLKTKLSNTNNEKDIAICYMKDKELSIFEHYFRHLYTIVKLVDRNQNLNLEDKKEYIHILSSGMSNYELILLFYYVLARNYDFKCLIEKYNMFKDINRNLLAKETHYSLYNKDAYYDKNVKLEFC